MIGARLKLARVAAGLSLRQLQDQVGGQASARALGKYERNEAMPDSTALLALAEALDVSLACLFGDPAAFAAVEFAGGSCLGKRDRAKLELQTLYLLERYLFIEDILGLPSVAWRKPRPCACSAPLDDAEAERIARSLRSHWRLGAAPIANPAELLEEHGIKILPAALEAADGLTVQVRLVKGGAIPVIIVNRQASAEAQRLLLAQALGDLMLDADKQASHRFARAFLIPAKAFRLEVGKRRSCISPQELAGLQAHFGISLEALADRCKDLQILSEAKHRELIHTLKACSPSVSKNSPAPPAEQPARFKRLTLRALDEQAISLPKAAELLGIPALELDSQLAPAPPSALAAG